MASSYFSTLINKEKESRKQIKEIKDIKASLKQLKKDADQQFKLEVESQQNFGFLAEQIRTLRNAVISIVDVVVEEMDVTRAEFAVKVQEIESNAHRLSKSIKVLQTENNILKSEFESYKQSTDVKLHAIISDVNNNSKKLENVEIEVQEVKKHGKENTSDIEDMAKNFAVKLEKNHKASTEQLEKLNESIDNLKRDHTKASTALAMDIANLAQQTTKYREQQAKTKLNIETVEKNIDKIMKQSDQIPALTSHQEIVQQNLEKIVKYQEKLRETITVLSDRMKQDRTKIDDVERDMQKKYSTISKALNSVIDMVSDNNLNTSIHHMLDQT